MTVLGFCRCNFYNTFTVYKSAKTHAQHTTTTTAATTSRTSRIFSPQIIYEGRTLKNTPGIVFAAYIASSLSPSCALLLQPRNLNHDLAVPYTRKDKGDETGDINLWAALPVKQQSSQFGFGESGARAEGLWLLVVMGMRHRKVVGKF